MPEFVGYERNNKIRRTLSKDMEKRLKSARDRLQFGMDYRSKKRENFWRQSIEQYENLWNWNKIFDDEMDVVNVNISFSTINTLVPYVSDENPKFIVEAQSGDATVENAALLEHYVNRLWRSPDVEGQIHVADSVWDYLVYGDGYGQIAWEIREKPQYDAVGDVIEGRGTEIANYGVERVSPWDIWIDPYADGIHNARWVCRRILMPVEELRNDERYRVLDEPQGGDVSVDDSYDPKDQDRTDYFAADGGWVAVYEFYDLVEDFMIAFPLAGGTPYRYIEGIQCPIVQIGNYRISNSPYHIGELEMIASLQVELNKTRSEMITHRQRNVQKWLVRNNEAVGEKALEAMKSREINAIIPVEGNEPFERLVSQLTPQALNGDAYMQDGIIRNDINEITGVNEYLRGSPPDISRTATEASIIEGATNVRTRHKLNQVETFLRRIGQRLLDTIAHTLPLTDFEEVSLYVTGREAERLNRVMGQEDLDTDIVFTPTEEIFTGKYVVDVERGSAELRNPQVREQRFKEMAQILLNSAPILTQFGINIDLRRALEMWFREAGVADVDAMFVGDEQQELMQAAAAMQAMQGAVPQQEGGARGAPTAAGDPRPQSTNPPTDMVSPENSGMLEGRPY